ncbi:HGGxSTG domain-containing protein [uncultured Thiodictyon sp.]|uniref:HGGxSTG domain-containing protein n=1 Tax=uncultured Thiodictyon sp. TaxID=1846217 RepID=UPI00345AF5C2
MLAPGSPTPRPGKRRCKLHGGLSTGPKTPGGRARSAQNLALVRRHSLAPSTQRHDGNAR